MFCVQLLDLPLGLMLGIILLRLECLAVHIIYYLRVEMTDIAKCRGDGCPIKEKCFRFASKADEHWQSYSNFYLL